MRERKPPAPERPGGFSIQEGVRGIKVVFFKWFKRASEAAEVSRWLKAGGDVHARDENGLTPLHSVASSETPAVVDALLEGDADVDARDENGLTPLHLAAAHSETPAVVNALLEAGADANARDGSNKTPFDFAKGNSAIKGTDVYWRLNEARFERGD